MSTSLIEQLKELDAKKKSLISGVLDEINERIDLLNNAGFSYHLVKGIEVSSPKTTSTRPPRSIDAILKTSIGRAITVAKTSKQNRQAAEEAANATSSKICVERDVKVPDSVRGIINEKLNAVYGKK